MSGKKQQKSGMSELSRESSGLMNETRIAHQVGSAPFSDEATTGPTGIDALQQTVRQAGVLPNAGAAEARERSTQSATDPKTVAQILGEIVWLLTQSPRHETMPIADLEWLVMPAILLKQFRIFYQNEKPVGVAFWALADDIVVRRIDQGEKRLSAAEWRCGKIKRIIDIVAPFGGERDIQKSVEQIN